MPHNHDDDAKAVEQHKAQHKQAARLFNQAIQSCARAGICLDVIFQEVIEVMVQGAITHDRPLSELVANLIETYEETRDFVAAAKTEQVLKPAGGPQ